MAKDAIQIATEAANQVKSEQQSTQQKAQQAKQQTSTQTNTNTKNYVSEAQAGRQAAINQAQYYHDATNVNAGSTSGVDGTRVNKGGSDTSSYIDQALKDYNSPTTSNGRNRTPTGVSEEIILPTNGPVNNDEKPSNNNYYYGGGGSGGSSGGGSSEPTIAEGDAPTAVDYGAAAGTVNRITQGVDMSGKIAEANQAWTDVNNNYANTSQPLINQAETDRNEAIDTYANDSQAIIDQLKGISDDAIAAYARDSGLSIDQVKAQINDILGGLQGVDEANVGRVDNISTREEENLLAHIIGTEKQRQINAINYNVQQGVNELERAKEDAAPQFQTMRNQISANEQTALDNQALYAEMRGDRGGIGQTQYGAIQNTAAVNQLAVNREQTKLSTDTARQIADLRAQGEFKKADALLQLTQSYLTQLMDLKKWGTEMNVNIDEFNIAVDEWEAEFNMKAKELLADTQLAAAQYTTGLEMQNQKDVLQNTLANEQQNASLNLSRTESLNQQRQELSQYLTNLGIQNAQYMSDNQINQIANILNQYMQNAQNMASTELSAANLAGVFSDKTPTAAMAQYTQEQLANAASQLLAAGLDLTADQIAALGMTEDQYKQLKKQQSSGGGGGGYNRSWYQTIRDAWDSLGRESGTGETLAQALKAGHTEEGYRVANRVLQQNASGGSGTGSSGKTSGSGAVR